ncbi:dethiobiotin synthase [Pelistega suis]|uniref:dethiobiotin synthase n=1 Tax=Pelistega suis TaxID=1631957 RepID=UPI00211C59DE|nr:dethiobiotin synthase [Pelistega suis]MCQ9329821.1 dethiobiotin synthase [Pelistega suis]
MLNLTHPHRVVFISGIDTDVGKTYATGWYAKQLMQQGINVITQKFVQTGCQSISDDIVMHRKLQGIPLQAVDQKGITCPYIFTHPCSPHLAAQLEKETIKEEVIFQSTQQLLQHYDCVLLEGAGGLYVPYNNHRTIIDYVQQQQYPLILVTSGKLGSINHTLLSLHACAQRNIPILSVIYNKYLDHDDRISQDTPLFLANYVQQHFPETAFITMGHLA